MDRLIITNQMIEDGMSKNGGWSNKQIVLLGFGRYSGWRKRALGKEILAEKYKEFLALKDVHLKNKKPRHKAEISTLLDKALTFTIEHFTDEGKFDCAYVQAGCNGECSECDVKKDVCDILGIE